MNEGGTFVIEGGGRVYEKMKECCCPFALGILLCMYMFWPSNRIIHSLVQARAYTYTPPACMVV